MNNSTIFDRVSPEVLPLLKRVFLFLEDHDWNSANQYCEKVLDMDPENAYAYLGKLLSQLHVSSVEALEKYPLPFDDRPVYQKVIRFGDADLTQTLESWNEGIRSRNAQAQKARKTARTQKTKRVLSAVLLVVCVVLLITQVIMPLNTYVKYRKAVSLMEQGNLEEAIAAFESMGAYRDSQSRKSELQKTVAYDYASALMEKEDFRAAKDVLRSLGDYKDSEEKLKSCYITLHGEEAYKWISSMEIGDVVQFGTFEQDDEEETKEPIAWRVLDIQGTSVFLLSDQILTYRYFNNWNEKYWGSLRSDWKFSSIWEWLNEDFYHSAFTIDEQALILKDNPSYPANVFLLSKEEAEEASYFPSSYERRCSSTWYAKANYEDAYDDYWMLRTIIEAKPEDWERYGANVYLYVNSGGEFSDEIVDRRDNGFSCNYPHPIGIRPAIWVSLDA